MQQPFRRPVFRGFIEHPSETERDFVERPTIHPGEIHGRRFDAVVDLQRVRFVARADQRAPHGRRPFADRKRLPIPFPSAGHETIKLVASLKNRAEREPRFCLDEIERKKKEKNN